MRSLIKVVPKNVDKPIKLIVRRVIRRSQYCWGSENPKNEMVGPSNKKG